MRDGQESVVIVQYAVELLTRRSIVQSSSDYRLRVNFLPK